MRAKRIYMVKTAASPRRTGASRYKFKNEFESDPNKLSRRTTHRQIPDRHCSIEKYFENLVYQIVTGFHMI